MSRVLWAGLIVVLLLGAALWVSGLLPNCCGARQYGNSSGAPVALVVIAIGRESEAESVHQFARVAAGIGPALR